MKKCIFCKMTGHNIQSCESSEIQPLVYHAEQKLAELPTRQNVMHYLQRIPILHLQLLSIKNHMRIDLQKGFLVEILTVWYYNRNTRQRNIELNRMYSLHLPTIPMPGVSLENTDINPFPQIDFTNESEIQDAFWEYIFIQRNYLRIPFDQIKRKIHLFYTSVQYANTEQHCRYNSFIDTIYNAEQSVQYISRDDDIFEMPDTRHWKITPFLIITTPKNMSRTYECPICICVVSKPETITTNCNHTFCNDCFNRFLLNCSRENAPSCPLCRKSVIHIETTSETIYDEYETAFT